jgi:hypothetical protein
MVTENAMMSMGITIAMAFNGAVAKAVFEGEI